MCVCLYIYTYIWVYMCLYIYVHTHVWTGYLTQQLRALAALSKEGFNSQHPYCNLLLSVTKFQEIQYPLLSSSGTKRACDTRTYKANYSFIEIIFNF